jgi:hypothetical protein
VQPLEQGVGTGDPARAEVDPRAVGQVAAAHGVAERPDLDGRGAVEQ